MAVAKTATATGNRATGSSTTLGVSTTCNTATTGTDTWAIMFVGISVSTNFATTTCAVTYGGVAMTQLTLLQLGSSTNRSVIGAYALKNPLTGAQTVAVTTAGTATKAAVAVGGGVYSGVANVGSVQSAASLALTASASGSGRVISASINGAAITSPTQTQMYLAGSSVGGVGDYLLVQDAAGINGTISFSSSGTATTPTTLAVSLDMAASKVETLTDEFTTKDVAKWTFTGTADAVSNQLSLVPNVSFGNTVVSVIKYDMRKSVLVGQLAQTPNVGSGTTMTFITISEMADQSDCLQFLWNNNVLTFRQRVDNVNSDTTLAWNATSHRWWRIQAYDGIFSGAVSDQIWFDTSPDGLVWTNRRQVSRNTALSLGSVWVSITAGFTGTEPTPGTALWENINIYPAIPKIATLSDDFTTLDTTTKWNAIGSSVTVSGGELVESTTTTGSDLITKSRYDLTSSAASAKITQIPAHQGPTEQNMVGIFIRKDESFVHHLLTMEIWNNLVLSREWIDGVDDNTTVTYNSTNHRYLRIRESGGTVYWDASPDGASWTNLRSKTPNFTPDNMVLQLSSMIWGTGTAGDTAKFDDFNIVPAVASNQFFHVIAP